MVPTRIRFGIQARLMASIAAVASGLVLLLGWYWSSHEEKTLVEALQQRQVRMAALVSRAFSAPLWNLDSVTISDLLDAVMADPEVFAITIQDNVTPLERSRAGEAVEPVNMDFEITHPDPTKADGKTHWRAKLIYTRAQVHDKVTQMRRLVAGLLAAVLAALLLTSYVMVNLLIKRPVSRLGLLAGRVAAGELGSRTEIERPDEIGRLTEQFNAMSAELRRSSEGLRASEARYRGLFENASEGIFQCDASGHLLDINGALAQMLGFATAGDVLILDKPLQRVIGLQPRMLRRVAAQLARQRRVQQWPLLVEASDGRPLWIELSARLVASGGGAARRIEGMVSDISQRHLAEEELARHRDHLEDLVQARTLELSEAKQRAESANTSKGRFLATMSHEFRTPLNAILGFTQLMQMDSTLGPAQQNKVALIRDSGDHLLSLISDVLDMASIEAGKVRLQAVPLDLRALLEVVADTIRVRAEQKALAFDVALDGALPSRVTTDGQRVRQVLLNLLSNAVKFTDQGGVLLSVRQVKRERSMATLRFAVRDSGIGMSADQVERLFQPFEQVAEDSRRAGGTGLGLSISQELVRLMDGTIDVHSEPGKGSEFFFELVLPVLD